MVPQPQRLQTAMTLYSESLSALILLVDDRLQTRKGIQKSKIMLCNQSINLRLACLYGTVHKKGKFSK